MEPGTGARRIDAIDVVRGGIMVVMLLDHARDFTHRGAFLFDPTDLERTTTGLFLTRWITHFCAPVFVFLAGVAARLQRLRGTGAAELSGFLWRRGLFLVGLELLVIRPLIWFNLDPRLLAQLQVIWATGWAMVVLAAVVRGPGWLAPALGLAIVAGHNLLDRYEDPGAPSPWWWSLLHRRAWIAVGPDGDMGIMAQYPVLPWIGVLLLGYAAGAVYGLPAARRRRALLLLGAAALVLFIALRAGNLYGDPLPWSPQDDAAFTAFSFVNTQKYPPSLLFLAMTIGPALLALAALDGREARGLSRPLVVFGRVPLFFYVLQWPLVHFVAWLFQAIDGQPVGFETRLESLFTPLPEGLGFPLSVTYAAWALALAVSYPLCAAYGRFKARHRDWRILSYL